MRSFVLACCFSAALGVLGAAGVTPAQAATIDAAGAAALKTVIDDTLAFYIDSNKAGGDGVTLSGPVVVEPKAGFYEVTLPGVSTTNPDSVFVIGTVKMNVTPGEGDTYRASIALPKDMTMKDKTGAERVRLSLGSQKFSGVWDKRLGLFTTADAAYGDVKAIITPDSAKAGNTGLKPVTITLGKIASMIAMKADGVDAWSGPQKTAVKDIVVSFGNTGANHLTISSIDAAIDYKKIDLSAGKKLRDRLHAAMQGGKALSPDVVREAVTSTFGTMSGLPEAVRSSFTLSDVALDLPDTKDATGAASPTSLRLKHLVSTSAFDGMREGAGSGLVSAKLSGLTLTGHDGPLTGLIPSDGAINLTAKRVPFKDLFALFGDAVGSALDAQATEGAAKDQAVAEMHTGLSALPALLAKAGTTVAITDTFTTAPDLSTKLDGSLAAVASSPYIFAGKTTLIVTGMDELVGKLQDLSRTANNPQAAGYAQMLILMQLSGQAGQGAQGKSQRTYALEFTPDGKVVLNGVNMQGLAPQAGAPAPAPVPAPAPAPKP